MTIPASAIVNVIPNVLTAGGNALVMNGMMLTQSYRVPINTVASFPSAATVGAFFGLTSPEYNNAVVYFNGYLNNTQQPGSMLVAQYPQTAVAAWLRTGVVVGYTIGQLAAITGSLNITIDGYTRTVASLNLSGATSFSAAAGLIQTALNTSLPTEAVSAVAGGTIAPATSSFVGTISDDVLTVTSVTSGTLVAGTILTGTGVSAGTQILNQLSGTVGGIGSYSVSIAQACPSANISGTYGILTITGSNVSGTFSIGQTISGTGVTAGTAIYQLGTGVGAAGTYFVSPSQTVGTAAQITASATACVVTFDSVSGSFFITSGVLGTASSIAFATGTAAAPLFMTAATGAVISQGAAGQTPAVFMAGLIVLTQNWASFWTVFDPDNGQGNAQKLLFAAWTSTTNNRYAFICQDTDPTPTNALPASSSLGALISTAQYAGTCLIWVPNFTYYHAAFIAGTIASVNYSAINGRITFAFRAQNGLIASVTNQLVSSNLLGNGYNFYGAYATANQSFVFFYNGSVSGPFLWLDSYVNQIWMNAQFQLDLMELLTNINSIPYNNTGYAMIESACLTTIQQALTFGMIRQGVPLSSLQQTVVDNAAGITIDPILSTQGWYFLVIPATPQVRAARQSPTCYFWYMDGQAVQQITLNSVELQ